MKLGLQVLARKGVFPAVAWGLVAISFLLIPLHERLSCSANGQLTNASFFLMITVGVLTQCVPPGAKRSMVPFFASAVAVILHFSFTH